MEALHDELIRTLAADGSASVRVLSATNLVREATRRHATSPAASVALGRALMGALLLASEAQDGERVQLQFRGDGPLGTVTVTAGSDGEVRGYLQHPQADPPLRGEELGVAEAMGMGALCVERNHPSWKRPYSGIVPMASGEIAQDLALYLLESEQKPSAVALGVYLGRDAQVEAAGGYLVQGLPGADENALSALEHRVAANSHPSARLRAGGGADRLLEQLLDGIESGELGRLVPRFHCPCSVERVRRAALLLDREELQEIARGDEGLEMHCAFCAERYQLSPDEVGSLVPDA